MSYTSEPSFCHWYNLSHSQEIPTIISAQDRERFTLASRLDTMARRVELYEEMVNRYSHPFFLVRLADMFIILKADTLSVDLYRKVCHLLSVYFDLTNQAQVQVNLSSIGIVDSGLDALINTYGPEVDRQVEENLARAREGNVLPLWGLVRAKSCCMSGPYYQKWRPTNQHRFPTYLPQLPLESREVKEQWKALAPEGSTFFNAYLTRLAIETNHVETTFLLTEEVCFL